MNGLVARVFASSILALLSWGWVVPEAHTLWVPPGPRPPVRIGDAVGQPCPQPAPSSESGGERPRTSPRVVTPSP